MAVSQTITRSVEGVGDPIAKTKTISGSLAIVLDETIANGQTDFQISVGIDVSAVKSFFLVSDQDITVETNDGTTPDDTLAMTADDPKVWDEDSSYTFELGTDVTDFFVTNASGSSANLQLRAIVDATPS